MLKKGRTFVVVTSLALMGGLFGALAGAATFAAGVFAIELWNGHLVWPFTIFGSVVGGLFGAVLGVLLGAALPMSAWRHVPIGRLFLQLTLGTIIGGSACAILIRLPAFAILGGILGFILAGNRLAIRSPAMPALQADERAE